MSVWQQVDKANISEIAHRSDAFEVFHSASGQLWYRHRTPQEAAELRMLHIERNPDPGRLDNALKIAPPP